MANQLVFALPRATDANGDPAPGALAYFYQTGTTTPVTVYSDEGLTTPHASPLVADSGGMFAQVFYGGGTLVKVVVQDADAGALYTLDPCPMIAGSSSAAEDVSYSPNINNPATDVQDALDNLADDVAASVPESRSITAGTGLTGGGTLAADRSLAVDFDSVAAQITLATKQASTSGSTIDFTGIPAGVTEIYVMFNGVSTNGTDNLIVQLGDSGGFETSGYVSASSNQSGGTGSTSGFAILRTNAATVTSGIITLRLMDAAAFTWVSSHAVGASGENAAGGGSKSLSAELTQVRITVPGSDTFDAGEINISYR